ncbi:conserved hypothetical protein [Histoplasma capsulatum var. duboisii H88]|uniref:Uncharacterized protein n=1 Tax=Ajellomyces capsulatus (strain H88) TaxID=544711 RepID=F0UUJ2_AJEC8|nr:conserved hypothetical protein [Histoplasma capsulatum var. duboisii H88]
MSFRGTNRGLPPTSTGASQPANAAEGGETSPTSSSGRRLLMTGLRSSAPHHRRFQPEGSPGSNPHAIERIPHLGAVVVASSTPGKLTLYYPGNAKDINDFKNLKKSDVTYDAPGAHGILWDPNDAQDSPERGILWVSLDKYMRKYKITGRGETMRLLQEGSAIPFPGKGGLGHDLQPDYTNKNVLLATDSYGVYAYDIPTGKWVTLREEMAIKSFVRHKSGEYLWVTKEGKGGWVSPWRYTSVEPLPITDLRDLPKPKA